MGTDKGRSGLFEKVRGVECLYRDRPTGAYYARFQVNGKEVRKSLRTSDRQIAKRELATVQGNQSRIDPSLRKLTLTGLADIYLKTVAGCARSIVAQKTRVCERIKKRWPVGSQISIAKVVRLRSRRFSLSIHSGRPITTHISGCFVRCSKSLLQIDYCRTRLSIVVNGRRRTNAVRLTPTYQ
jgi:hypothetical protein